MAADHRPDLGPATVNIMQINNRRYSKLVGAVGAALTATAAAILEPSTETITVAFTVWAGAVAVWGATNNG